MDSRHGPPSSPEAAPSRASQLHPTDSAAGALGLSLGLGSSKGAPEAAWAPDGAKRRRTESSPERAEKAELGTVCPAILNLNHGVGPASHPACMSLPRRTVHAPSGGTVVGCNAQSHERRDKDPPQGVLGRKRDRDLMSPGGVGLHTPQKDDSHTALAVVQPQRSAPPSEQFQGSPAMPCRVAHQLPARLPSPEPAAVASGGRLLARPPSILWGSLPGELVVRPSHGLASGTALSAQPGPVVPAADMMLLYECQVCGKAFNKPQSLGGHMRTHLADRGPHEPQVDQKLRRSGPEAPLTGRETMERVHPKLRVFVTSSESKESSKSFSHAPLASTGASTQDDTPFDSPQGGGGHAKRPRPVWNYRIMSPCIGERAVRHFPV